MFGRPSASIRLAVERDADVIEHDVGRHVVRPDDHHVDGVAEAKGHARSEVVDEDAATR